MLDAELYERASHLQRFYSILNYELSTIVLFILKIYWQFTLFLAALAAILFMPYLLCILIKEKKRAWLILFISMVILPLLIIVLFLSEHLFYLAYIQIPLLLFYLYCFMLRFEAKEWLTEINWKVLREKEMQKPKTDDDFLVLR